MKFKTIKNEDLRAGTKVLLRLDLNVPIESGKIVDDFRIKAIYSTLRLLQSSVAKTVIISHADKDKSLTPVAEYLKKDFSIKFWSSLKEVNLEELDKGEFGLAENIRFEKGEGENDPVLAKKLASLGNIFINEAFSVSHRHHASIIGVTKYIPSFAGLRFYSEVENLSKAFNPLHPALLILGGAKALTKLPVAEKFLGHYQNIFIGGALANDFFKFRGLEVGQSKLSERPINLKTLSKSEKVILPEDVLVSNGLKLESKNPLGVLKSERIVDVGDKTLQQIKKLFSEAKFIVWNGPLGIYEEGFHETTEKLADMIVRSGAHSIIGGGDTLAIIKKLGLESKFGFVSTGGGAMLDFLANETLPGIEALEQNLASFKTS